MGNLFSECDPFDCDDGVEIEAHEMELDYWENFNKNSSHTQDFKIISLIGSGRCSNVYCAERKIDQKLYALKVMRVGIYEKMVEGYVQTEASIMHSLHHPNIIKFFDHYAESISPGRSVHVLVMELAKGGQLFDRIAQKKMYTEKEAKDVMFTLLSAIKHCHDRGIIHRDLKPENILLVDNGDEEQIKICDFGYATRVSGQDVLEFVGTPLYLAPEILTLRPKYTYAVDMWSLGVICFILLGGYPPFYGRTNQLLFAKLKRGKPRWNKELWCHVSDDAKDLIKGLLKKNPRKRLTVKQALNHPWIRTSNQALSKNTLNLDVLKKWNKRRKIKIDVQNSKPQPDHHRPKSTINLKLKLEKSPNEREKRGRSDTSIFFDDKGRSFSSNDLKKAGPDRRSSVWTPSEPSTPTEEASSSGENAHFDFDKDFD